MFFDEMKIKGRSIGIAMLTGCLSVAVNGVVLPDESYDVAVIGGGTAGIVAALQSAQAGARTVLIEQGSQVGGTMTSGGVNFPGLFHAWGRQVIDGIGYSLVTNCVALAGDVLPDMKQPVGLDHWKHQISINVPLYVALAEESLVKSGTRICYHAAPMAIAQAEGGWELTVVAIGDVWKVRVKQVIDCTGNAAVAHLAGFARVKGAERQPGSFVYTLDPRVDLNTVDRDELDRQFALALQDGRLLEKDIRWGIFNFLKCKGNTANYVIDADNSTARLRTQTNMRGRASMLRVYRFIKGLKGFEKARLTSMSQEVGVRETYRIVGEYEITVDDYVSGKVFEDSLCYAFYPVDMHDPKTGVDPRHLKEGVVATVPLRALTPKGSHNLMVAGRCVSSDRGANSGLRVEAACMAMGQVAGATAALAAKRNVSPLQLPIADVKALLRTSGAIVPDIFD